MSTEAPLALKLAPGFVKGMLKLLVPSEYRPILDPAIDAVDWSLQASAELAKAGFERAKAAEELRALSQPRIASLLAALAREGAALNPEQSAWVVEALDRALLGAQIARAEALVEARLDPARVEERLREVVQADLAAADGPVATALARLLGEAARALVASASSRPGFDEAVAARLLQALLPAADELRRTRELLADLAEKRSADRGFASAWLRAVAAQTAWLRTAGLPAETVPIERAVWATLDGPHGEAPLPALVAENPRLLVLGDAGAGKSTRLARLAWRLATRDGSLPPVLAGRMPIFVPLRKLAGRGFPDPRGLLAVALPNLADEAPRGWAQRSFRRGAVLLLDGLDELARAERRAIFDGITALFRDFPDGRLAVVLAGRPGSVLALDGRPLVATQAWTTAQIRPLGAPARDDLIRAWEEHAHRDPSRAERRIAAITADPALDALTRNPLLAGLCCAAELGNAEGATVTGSAVHRAGLCLRAVDTLLRRPFADGLALSVDERRRVLGSLALWFHQNDPVSAPTALADAALASLGASDPTDLRHALVEVSGLLRYEGGQLAFTHRALQHALAAEALLRSGSHGLLARVAHREEWREVTDDALALAAPAARADILARILRERDRHPRRAAALSRFC